MRNRRTSKRPPSAAGAARLQDSAGAERDQFLTPTQVADRLLVAPVTVRLWASRGLLPSTLTPGGHRRFRASDVESFIERQRQVQGMAASRPSRVLIIDDDEQFARYLADLLVRRAPGVRVEIALDAFTAGLKCEALRPEVVTLDLHMPDIDGFEICRLLRSMFGASRPRIVALTGFPSTANTERVLEAGASACIAKTAPSEVLLRELGLQPSTPGRRGRSAEPPAGSGA